MRPYVVAVITLTLSFRPHSLPADEAYLPEQALVAMKKAATFYREQVASHGGYVYFYSLDTGQRWGEGLATKDLIWIQPPGTLTVGLAFLTAYEVTGDGFYLDAATDAALAVAYGQLKSGGWTNLVDFDSRSPRTAAYRNGKGRGKNNSSLDDGQTQLAIKPLFMVRRGAVYTLTYDDSSLPAHYGWKSGSRLRELRSQYDALIGGGDTAKPEVTDDKTRRIIAALDARGRWVSTYDGQRLVGQPKMPAGAKYLSSEVFSRNLVALSECVRARSGPDTDGDRLPSP
jgi:hypothetical protein